MSSNNPNDKKGTTLNELASKNDVDGLRKLLPEIARKMKIETMGRFNLLGELIAAIRTADEYGSKEAHELLTSFMEQTTEYFVSRYPTTLDANETERKLVQLLSKATITHYKGEKSLNELAKDNEIEDLKALLMDYDGIFQKMPLMGDKITDEALQKYKTMTEEIESAFGTAEELGNKESMDLLYKFKRFLSMWVNPKLRFSIKEDLNRCDEENLYEIKTIEGKNLGIVALKDIQEGTLILKEKPQFADLEGDEDMEQTEFDSRQLCQSFFSMRKSDQQEYLKLYSQYSIEEMMGKFVGNRPENDEEFEILVFFVKLIGIYQTNKSEGGVGIKVSRFNHACSSNAERIFNYIDDVIEIRALKDIKMGEEITINYLTDEKCNKGYAIMKKYKQRQEYLKSNWKFDCQCDYCIEDVANNFDEFYDKFDQLMQDANNFDNVLSPEPYNVPYPETYLKHIELCKAMFQLVKGKQMSKYFISRKILHKGFLVAVHGVIVSIEKNDLKNRDLFFKEYNAFQALIFKIGEKVFPSSFLRGMEKDLNDMWIWVARKYSPGMSGFEFRINYDYFLKHCPTGVTI